MGLEQKKPAVVIQRSREITLSVDLPNSDEMKAVVRDGYLVTFKVPSVAVEKWYPILLDFLGEVHKAVEETGGVK